MISLRKLDDTTLEITLGGTLTRDDIRKCEGEMKALLAQKGRLGLVFDMSNLSDMTADALAEDLPFELSLMPQLPRFAAMAMVSDKQWVAAICNYIKPWLPNVHMAVFAPGEV